MLNKTQKIIIATAVVLIGAFIGGTIAYKSEQTKQASFIATENSERFVRDYSPRYGAKDAKVFLVEFLDPECESCRAFYPRIKNLLAEFPGKVQLVIRYAPFHGNSKIAIAALEAARAQGKYWEALELLFHYQPQWGSHHNPKPELIFEYLPKIGLDMGKLNLDMKDPKIQKIIEQDSEDLRALNVRGTPSLYVNGRTPEKFGMEPLRELIKEEIKKHYGN